ncbi:hypothetical protein V496_02966, partial [Pseudogymnoascus sp. VKM F-4515 (FW-2607)]
AGGVAEEDSTGQSADTTVEDPESRDAAVGDQAGGAAQAERERQGRWVDSGIDVPNSSMRIPAPSSEVLDPGSVIVASQPFTDQNPTPSEEGHSIPRSRCSSVSFDQGFAADHDPVGESLAQKVCTQWAETREGSNRFRKVEGGVCQYDGIVRAAVAAMSIAALVEVAREGLFGQMKAMGI